MDRLFRPEDDAELAGAMDLDALVAHAPGVELGASVVPIDLAPGGGLGGLERGFGTKLSCSRKAGRTRRTPTRTGSPCTTSSQGGSACGIFHQVSFRVPRFRMSMGIRNDLSW
jgi:hypothetical protein